jgi:predicted Zn finger-like uncharacterized protein
MKITCPSCSARYSIDDAKVKGKAFKFTCKKCGQTHVYRGTGDGAAAVTGGPAAGAPAGGGPAGGGFEDEAVWYVAVGEEQQGPYTAQQIREYAQTDQLDPESFIWKEGMEDWLPYQQIPEFADLAVGGGGEAPAPAAPSPADSPFGGIPDDVTVASPFAAAAPPPADSGDLFAFGGGQRAAKPAESSPFDAFGAGGGGAAAVAARGGADVFGAAEQSPFDQTEDREQDVMMGAAAAAGASPRIDASKMIGQRNENSVLFSLSSLQALAGGRGGGAAAPAASVPSASVAAGPKPGFAGGEGSGLIDIRAMAGASARREEKPDDLFSLGGGGAIGAPVAVPILTRPIRHDDESKRPMYILVGVIGAFAIAIIVLLVFLLKGGDKEKVVVKEVPAVAGDTDGGTVVAATAGGPEADAGTATEEPDAGAAKTDEDKGAAGDAGTDVPGDGDPNAKAADGADGGDTGEPPGSTGTGRRRDGGRNPGGDDPGGPATGPGDPPPARDAGSSGQTRDAGRLAGDLSAIGLTPRRDAGSSSSSQQGSSSGLSATPDRDAVRSKFESVRGAVRACTGGQAGTAQAQTTVQGSTGRVTRVNVTGDFTGPAATCITNAIRGLQFPQFSNPTLTVNYSYRF